LESVGASSPTESPVPKLSKSVMKAFRSAKKAGGARDVKSRRICAEQRAKREGTDHPFEPVILEKPTPKVQASLSDF